MTKLSYWLQSECSITVLRLTTDLIITSLLHIIDLMYFRYIHTSLGAKKSLLGTLLRISWRISVIYLLLMSA